MIPPIYTHTTPKSDKVRPGLDCSVFEDKTRQEFKQECDINWQLKRYGAGVPLRQVAFGENNFDLDRLTALNEVSRLQTAFYALPAHIRDKYRSWDDVFTAIQAGELTSLNEPSPAAEKAAE